jgi:hypothetical protein
MDILSKKKESLFQPLNKLNIFLDSVSFMVFLTKEEIEKNISKAKIVFRLLLKIWPLLLV